jgi:hypothetical protein
MSNTVRADKIASVVSRLELPDQIPLTSELESRSGNVVVVRVLPLGKSSQELELVDGRMIKMFGGDVVVGALGRRRALRGWPGDVPSDAKIGDQLAILNRGGVIGVPAADTGQTSPLKCEVLGMPLIDGRIPNLKDNTLPEVSTLKGRSLPPVGIVSGTCMQSGKTNFLSKLTQGLTKAGIRVAAGKLTGVACQRDLFAMQDNGAVRTASFQDAGYPSTAGLGHEELVATAKAVIAHLAESDPEVILLEFGDGLIGDYGVVDVLMDDEIRDVIRVHAFCANDLAGAWAGDRYCKDNGLDIDLYSGPVTDNLVGIEYIESHLDRPAVNAGKHPARLAEVVLGLLDMKSRRVS